MNYKNDVEISYFPSLCSICGPKQRQEDEEKRIADRRLEAEAELPAVIEKQRLHWWESANLPSKFAGAYFRNFKAALQPKAFEVIKHFTTEDFGDDVQPSVLLLSPNLFGVGKTHLLCALVNEMIDTAEAARISREGYIRTSPPRFYYTTETALLSRIRATFNRHDEDDEKAETETQVYNFLHNIGILLIDDVGKVRPHDISFLQSVYFNIIDGRYTGEQPIIMASNLSPTEFEAHVGGACADRLREMCGKNIIVMKGQSYRLRGVKGLP